MEVRETKGVLVENGRDRNKKGMSRKLKEEKRGKSSQKMEVKIAKRVFLENGRKGNKKSMSRKRKKLRRKTEKN